MKILMLDGCSYPELMLLTISFAVHTLRANHKSTATHNRLAIS